MDDAEASLIQAWLPKSWLLNVSNSKNVLVHSSYQGFSGKNAEAALVS